MALKPVPKAILIMAAVSIAAFAGMKFIPEPTPADQVTTATDTIQVVPPTQAQVEAAAAPAPQSEDVPVPAVIAPAEQTSRDNVSNGDAGLSAVLGAGR